jgi:hypothetical protein
MRRDRYLIDKATQIEISTAIDAAVAVVLAELPNHGGEEGLTPVLGHALMRQSFRSRGLSVDFNYRQLSKHTEEPIAGADGGLLVRVASPAGRAVKAALFQAKVLTGRGDVRGLSLPVTAARRLRNQCTDMLTHSDEAVAVFYTRGEIYVVDARRYETASDADAGRPLSERYRLLTLGTYLGRWLPRCTRGDQSPELVSRIERPGGFKHNVTLDVTSDRPPIAWPDTPAIDPLGALKLKRRKRVHA